MAFQYPDQQAVWDTVRALNDTWTKGNPADLARYFHPDMVAITATDRHRLIGRETCLASWTDFAETTAIEEWTEIDPLVQIYGDTAVVTYEFDIRFVMGGHPLTMHGRDMFVLIRQDGSWLAVADHFSPAPG